MGRDEALIQRIERLITGSSAHLPEPSDTHIATLEVRV